MADDPTAAPPEPDQDKHLDRFFGPVTLEGPTPDTVRRRLLLPADLTHDQLAASFRLAAQREQLYPLEIQVLREAGMLA